MGWKRKIEETVDYASIIRKQREEIETLKIEHAHKIEEYDRREREIEHKVGLQQQKQEHEKEMLQKEKELLSREAKVDAAEAGNTEQKKMHEAQIAFMEGKFEVFLGRLDTITQALIERLPSAEIIARIGEAPHPRSRARKT